MSQQSNFGTGFLFGIASGATPTPRLFGALQDIAIDDSFDIKPLYGQSQGAIEQGRGKRKIELKATFGRIDPNLFNELYFGLTATVGQTIGSVSEQVTILTNTYTVANATTFSTDLGVYNATAGIFLKRVASAPVTGQYSVVPSTGIYTFASADSGMNARVYYTYTSATTGVGIPSTNQQMGSSPIFGVQLINSFRGKQMTLVFPTVQSAKLSLPAKMDDFTMGTIDMSAQDDGSGNMYYSYYG